MKRRRLVAVLAVAGLAIVAIEILAASFPVPVASPDGSVPTSTATPPTPFNRTQPDAPLSLPGFPFDLLIATGTILLVVAAAAVLHRSMGRQTNPTIDPVQDAKEVEGMEAVSLDEVAATAGRTADRLTRSEDADLENEVYRAWLEMTTHLPVPNHRTRTAGEFADAAIRAGMSAEDVRALTTLFENIRYGDETPTESDERQAIDLLRRIESTYGGDE